MSQLPWYCTNGHHPIDNMQLQELNYPQTTDMTLKIRYWFCGRPLAAVEVLPRVPVHVGVSGPHDSYPGYVHAACPSRFIFLFLWFFVVFEILCQNIYFQILYLKIFCLKFFSTKFFSFTKFCTTIFLPKFIDLSKFFHEIFLFRVFLLIFSLKALFKIVCISLVNFLFI